MSHLYSSYTYAQSEMNRNPTRFRRHVRLSLQSLALFKKLCQLSITILALWLQMCHCWTCCSIFGIWFLKRFCHLPSNPRQPSVSKTPDKCRRRLNSHTVCLGFSLWDNQTQSCDVRASHPCTTLPHQYWKQSVLSAVSSHSINLVTYLIVQQTTAEEKKGKNCHQRKNTFPVNVLIYVFPLSLYLLFDFCVLFFFCPLLTPHRRRSSWTSVSTEISYCAA